jgi:hypothetical protein
MVPLLYAIRVGGNTVTIDFIGAILQLLVDPYLLLIAAGLVWTQRDDS